LAEPSAAASDSSGAPSDRLTLRTLLIVFSAMSAVLLELIDSSIVNVALPTLMGSLSATLEEIDWVVTGYIVSNVIVIPTTGWMSERFGRKRYFVTSILVFTAASAMCGFSRTVDQLVFWRIAQGLGGGALISTAQAILIESFPPHRQGIGQSIFGIGAMAGPSLGPTLGGFITDHFSWHWIFFVNIPLGLMAAAICSAFLKDPPHLVRRKHGRIDWQGFALLAIGVGSMQWMLEDGNREGWFESSKITALAVVGVLGVGGLIWRELSIPDPIVDFRILKNRQLALGCLLGALTSVGLFGSILMFPIFTQTLLGWTALESGLGSLPATISTAIAMTIVGRSVWALGPRLLFTLGMFLMMAALFSMRSWTLDAGWAQIWWPQVLRGMAMGALSVPNSTASLRGIPNAQIPRAAGIYNLTRQLGAAFGIAMLTTLLDSRTDVHRSALAPHLSPLEPDATNMLAQVTENLTRSGLDPDSAQIAATALLGRQLERVAMSLAFSDIYGYLGTAFVLCLPLAFFMIKHAPGKYDKIPDSDPVPQGASSAAQ
jgi:DHA2 family multidrug resistance protein